MAFRIVQESAYDGPSLWHDRPVVRVIVEGRLTTGGDELLALGRHLEQLESKVDRTRITPRSLPPLPERLDAPWVLAWMALGLQRLAGDDVTTFSARELEPPDTSEVVVACVHRQTGMLALRIALYALNASAGGNQGRVSDFLDEAFSKRLVPVAASRRPTVELSCILEAARARGIPITSVDPHGAVRELGHGVYRRRLRHTSTSNTSYLGTLISREKHLSLHYLAEFGLPVVKTLVARDAEQAVSAAREIGFPVAIKPNDEGNSAGLYLDVRDEDEVRVAFEAAARTSRSGTVAVQPFLTDRHYRVLVAGDRIVGIAERIAAHVVGDGEHTVRELVEIENRNPRRGTHKSDRLKKIVLDDTSERLLAKQGLTLNDVPPQGLEVQLQRIDDLDTGGEAIIQTGRVHPDNEAIILSAVRAMELDIAGVDLIAEDIGTSIWESSGGILEVNSDTGFSLIQFPTSEGAIDPGPAVIESLFPAGSPVRVPLVAVTGDRDRSAVARLAGRMLAASGQTTGIALQDGLYLGATRLSGFKGVGVAAKRRILLNPAVESAVLEISPDEIVEEGLAFEQCDAAVVTWLSKSAPEELGPAEAVLVRTVAPGGAVVALVEDEAVVTLARRMGRSVLLFGRGDEAEKRMRERNPDDGVVLLDANGVLEITWRGETWSGPIGFAAEGCSAGVLAAIGAVVVAGVPVTSVPYVLHAAGVFLQ